MDAINNVAFPGPAYASSGVFQLDQDDSLDPESPVSERRTRPATETLALVYGRLPGTDPPGGGIEKGVWPLSVYQDSSTTTRIRTIVIGL